jgi:hypothetical protein
MNKMTKAADLAHIGCCVITGTLKNGKRFDPIYTLTPQHYNIWKGTVWCIDKNGKRYKMYTINN